jgi:hypothetical protein
VGAMRMGPGIANRRLRLFDDIRKGIIDGEICIY